MARQRNTYMMDRADGESEVDDQPTLPKVVGTMRQFAIDALEDPDFREYVTDCTQNLLQGDYNGEILACYYDVCQNVRYSKDPLGVELVQTPQRTLKVHSGDCDDIATLLAAMLMAIGHRVRFCLVGFHAGGAPSHVYVEAAVPGGWKTLDPVANRDTGEMLSRVQVKYNVNVGGGRAADDAFGMGISRTIGNPRHSKKGQVFSVFDYQEGVYRYYAAPLSEVPASGFYRKASGRLAEHMAAALPSGAKSIGEGPDPQGIIASQSSREGSLGRALVKLALIGGGVAVSVWAYRRYKAWEHEANG